MARITRVLPVLPVPLVAAALGGALAMPRDELATRVGALAADLKQRGAHLHLPTGSTEVTTEAGLHTLGKRGIVLGDGGAGHGATGRRRADGVLRGLSSAGARCSCGVKTGKIA